MFKRLLKPFPVFGVVFITEEEKQALKCGFIHSVNKEEFMNNSPLKLDLDIVIYSDLKYTLSGNSRSGTATVSDPTSTALDNLTGNIPKFNKGQVLKFRRARLIPDAPGLQVGNQGDFGGRFEVFQGKSGMGGSFTPTTGTDSVSLKFMRFDEWEDTNFEMKFEDDGSELGVSGYVSVSDFNIQEDWVGQDVCFRIEAEAELYIGD